MKTDEYLRQLSKYLKKLPKADYDDAMEYFTEYFAETDENEAKKLMDELGTPKEAACDIISNILEKKIDEKKQADSEKKQVDSDKKSVFGVLWIALLAIFALPVATPLLISSLIVMFCVLLCVLLAVLCVFLFGVCAAIAGMAVIARAIVTVKLSISSAIMLSGLGLAAIGVGIIIVLLGVLCVRLFAELTIKFAHKASKRGKNNDKIYKGSIDNRDFMYSFWYGHIFCRQGNGRRKICKEHGF